MSKDGRELVKEAVRDAKSLKEAALSAAKNQIIESMAPNLRRLIESSINGALAGEDVDRLRRGVQDNAPGESHTGFEEGSNKGDNTMKPMDDKELDMEALASFFPQLSEMGDEEGASDGDDAGPLGGDEEGELEGESLGMGGIPTLGEGDYAEEEDNQMEAKDNEEEENMDEEIEISEAELRKVYEAALQTEAQVSKNFGEMTKSGELDEVDPAGGIADFKKGESNWAENTPPAKQDFTVKEMINRGLHENKVLREHLGKAVRMIKHLGGKLHEVNLFNSKVLHVNRILNTGGRLTKEQKKVVVESIDKARSIGEVKMVFEAIVGSFKASQNLNENRDPRKPAANAQRARTSGTPNQKVLSESVDRGNNDKYARIKQLAGLVK